MKYWGYSSFRPFQEDIVDSVMEGRDTLALLPTGDDKTQTIHRHGRNLKADALATTRG